MILKPPGTARAAFFLVIVPYAGICREVAPKNERLSS